MNVVGLKYYDAANFSADAILFRKGFYPFLSKRKNALSAKFVGGLH